MSIDYASVSVNTRVTNGVSVTEEMSYSGSAYVPREGNFGPCEQFGRLLDAFQGVRVRTTREPGQPDQVETTPMTGRFEWRYELDRGLILEARISSGGSGVLNDNALQIRYGQESASSPRGFFSPGTPNAFLVLLGFSSGDDIQLEPGLSGTTFGTFTGTASGTNNTTSSSGNNTFSYTASKTLTASIDGRPLVPCPR
jgi:hypothetical protein